jgi:hypothetical protein
MWRARFFWTLVAAVACGGNYAYGAAGTSQIASKGSPVGEMSQWPAGVLALVNDPTRTDGWNDWFSEWPNDVNQYQFQVADVDQVNGLIAKLAEIKFKPVRVYLSPLKEPRGYGWVSSLPEGNDTAVMLSIGDQKRIDEWYRHLPEGRFGVMKFTSVPTAVPPTLTLFVRNKAIDLARLRIPENVEVSLRGIPRCFDIRAATKADEKEPAKVDETKLDAETLAATKAIGEFLKQRKDQATSTKRE